MSDQISKDLLKNGEIYDFDTAMNDYGFPFDDYLETCFESFIKSTFIKDFITLRKAFADHSYDDIRFYTHKFKSPFQLMCSEKIHTLCEQIQNSIDQKNYNIDNLCSELISKMLEFFQELVSFLKKVDHAPDKKIVDQFIKLNKECDAYKGCQIKSGVNDSSIAGGHTTDKKSIEKISNGKNIGDQNVNGLIVESKDNPINKKVAGYCCTSSVCLVY